MVLARLQSRAIEALSERTANSTTWALPSGELRTTAYAGPVRQKVEGAWKSIDTALADTGPSLEPKVAAADITVSDGGDAELASVAKGGKSFAMGWGSTLPAPEVAGDTAAYALGGGETLTVTALPQGFSQNVVLDRAPGSTPSYRIPVKLKGLKLSEAASGRLLLKDSEGTLVAEAPAPMMWDSSKDPMSGESRHQARVSTRIETASDGTQALVLTPDAEYFARNLTYPVTVDPTSTLAATTDTWVATNYPDSQVSSTELKSGTYDGGTTKARAYLKFDVSALKGKRITDTNLALYSYYSSTCATTGAGTQVRQVTSAWSSSDITWSAQPTTTATGAVTSTAAKGYNASCPAGTVNFDIDEIVRSWAGGAANHGVRVAGVSETDSLTWRRWRSANFVSGNGSTEPQLTVTYNSYPSVPTGATVTPSVVNAYDSRRYVTSLTPTLASKVSDPDGSATKAQFEIAPDPAFADTTYTYTGTSAAVSSGATVTHAVPPTAALPADKHLRFRARAHDGSDYGPWTGWSTFVLNTGKPAAPAVTCATYERNGWTAKATAPVSCTLNTASADGAGYWWGLDNTSVPNKKLDTANGTGGDQQSISIDPAPGWHTLYARTVDTAGNVSAATAYSFGVGEDGAAVLSPQHGDNTARRLTLTAKGLPSYTGATWQYRRGEQDSWRPVPAADVTAEGTTVSSWPVQVTAGTAAKLVWNVVSTLVEDGVIELRAVFTDGTSTGNSQSVKFTLDRDAGTAPAAQIGLGSVNQLTGDHTMSATDASAFDASVSRTYSSRANPGDNEGQADIYGPGWTSSVTAGSNTYTQIRRTSGTSVELLSGDGSAIAFTATATGWQPQAGSEGLTLTGTMTGDRFTLTDDGTNVTVFAKAAGPATTWTLATTASGVDDSTMTVAAEPVTVDGRTLARPKYVIAPTSAVTASVCQTTVSARGCRALEFLYAQTTTAAGEALGDYRDRVTSVKLWATDPGAQNATAQTIASYAYDASGRLRQVWDPRISPALKTAYAYAADGRLSTVTEPGELPWTFTYGKAGSALTAGEGMLLKVSRPALAKGTANTVSGTAATTVVYDVPLSGARAPHQMDSSTVAGWGQQDAPTDATAVLPADAVPASSTGNDLTPNAYARAVITYINANAEEVNVASPGGGITTADYDTHGNIVRELDAAGRELALGQGPGAAARLAALGLSDHTTAERAHLLSSRNVYSADGWRQTDEYGPLHEVTLGEELTGQTNGAALPAGSVVRGQAHTSYTYDENRPADAKVADLVTSTRTGAAIEGYPTDGDVRVATNTYDWSTGLRTSTTERAGATAITQRTTHDTAGRVIRTQLPASAGADAGTRIHNYYTHDGTGVCGGRPEWAGWLCRTSPAGAVTGGAAGNPTDLVTTTYTYNRWGQAVGKAETASGVTRTQNTTVDEAGRTVRTEVTGGIGEPIAPVTLTYDPQTGRPTGQSADGRTVAQHYDTLGRLISYSDGTGNTATTEYDILGRPVNLTDSVPSTTTYTYDSAGNAVSLTDSVAGTFTAEYDANGALTRQALPGGYNLHLTTDTAGRTTDRVYTAANGTPLLSDSASHTVHGDQYGHTQSDGATTATTYTYDRAGRLTNASDTTAAGCTSRAYTFDVNSNRTALTTSADDCDPTTPDTVTNTAAYSYDSADRLTTHTYDAFGRTTNNADAQLGYHVNDMVATETVGDRRNSWTLDAVGRFATQAAQTKTDQVWRTDSTTTNHYSCACDSPSWTRSGATVTRNVSDLSEGMAARTSANGQVVLQLTNLHNDIAVELPLDPALAPVVRHYDEYGRPLGSQGSSDYGWLGRYQRSAGTLSGLTLMGARLYDRGNGRFLSVDREYGGSCNAYDYACGDPVGGLDLSGTRFKYRDQRQCTRYTCIGIRRTCDERNRCSVATHLTFRKEWRDAYIHVGLTWTLYVDGYYVKKDRYDHGEFGTYKFHGYWFSNNEEKGRGWFKCSIWKCRLDPGDTVLITWEGKATLYRTAYAISAGQTFSGGGRYHS
ncbi:DNRLRE domain-containing protein [Streptomyces sp. NPDC059816]|uniref:DNRLRE domain-containing protein n=1 Tax=Streptomyces sp. NPDC059816 TaxID=3346960 RepID=UPI00365AF79A